MSEFRMTENQSLPMDHKRAVKGERLEYKEDLPLDKQPNPAFNIKTGLITEVVKPTYGLVRDRDYKWTPDE